MTWRISGMLALMVAGSGAAVAGTIGDPDDMYVLSDSQSEVYQFERVSPWSHIQGSYAGSLASPYDMVFSNSAQCNSNFPYLGAVAGTNANLFVGGFGSLEMVNSTTGANIMTVGAAGLRLGPREAPNGNIVVGGPSGTEEYDANTGAFVRNVQSVYGNGYNLHAFQGSTMYVVPWGFSSPVGGIQQFDFASGNYLGTIPVPFAPQEISFGPDGALYATALYEGPGVEGLWRYDSGSGSWSQFIDVQALAGGGPHGFTYDPQTLDLYMAFNTGEVHRFHPVSGAWLGQVAYVPAKLTDILFHVVVPEPATFCLLGLGALALRRRR